VIYSLGSYDHHFARVAYQNKEDAEKFKNDLLADGCKAIVKEATEAEIVKYNL
tara:strand:- start:112 stop:270 length:159 start_codon:yes stop_codon:yes gene_type:complete